MAEHMTAEQLRAELERIANHCEDSGLIIAPRELRNLAARLSGMAAVPTCCPRQLTGGDVTRIAASLTHEFRLSPDLAEKCVRNVCRQVAPALLAESPEPPHV